MIISIISRKGGSGKSLTALHIAGWLYAQGRPVAVVDLDPEGTALAWSRASPDLPFRIYPGRQLQEVAAQNLDVVIDTPPNDPSTLGLAARAADKVIVVSGANPLELDRLGPTLDALKASGHSAEWGILLTNVPRGNLGPAMKEVLEAVGLRVLGLIPSRVEYQRSFGAAPVRLAEYGAALEGWL